MTTQTKTWERYNWTTSEIEDQVEFDKNEVAEFQNEDYMKDLALDWLSGDEDQSGEWTESGYVYQKDGQTFEVRKSAPYLITFE